MRKMIFSMLVAFVVIGAGIAGCKSDDKIDSSMLSSGTNVSEAVQNENDNLDKQSYAGLEDVFSDTKVITPNGKYMMMVFGANGCPYCEKLKQDIKNNSDVRSYIKDNFTSYYINMSYSKIHDFKVGTKDDPREVKISTPQLSKMYDIRPTPTIVFADADGKTILEFPGYIPAKQFLAMLEFIGTGEWKKAKDQRELNELLNKYVMNQSKS